MKRIYFLFTFLSGLLLISSCNNDDDGVDPNFIPARDRAIEAVDSTEEIESFLQTHFYNYEEFANPPAGFNFKIKFDTIAGDNIDKIPLIEQVDFKMVKDRINSDVTYKIYYLSVIEGEGESPDFPDFVTLSYEGRQFNNEPDNTSSALEEFELFDSSIVPVKFDLTTIVNGLQDILIEFKGATGSTTNPDGTISFENYGVGAAFIPTGLGYYVNTPPGSNIPIYAQLIFTFQLYEVEVGDQDEDNVPSVVEDVNGNGLEEDDDTDGDTIPNFVDTDDDGDLRLTKDEVEVDSNGNVTYPDTDNDGIPDYLDADS
jgi:hypothetical protein